MIDSEYLVDMERFIELSIGRDNSNLESEIIDVFTKSPIDGNMVLSSKQMRQTAISQRTAVASSLYQNLLNVVLLSPRISVEDYSTGEKMAFDTLFAAGIIIENK